jgi:hypothetical protein
MARADRPPGRERDGGPAAEPDRHLCRNPAARSDAEVIHRVADGADIGQRRRAAWLRLSDERDLWLRRVLDAWREGYAVGRRSMDDAVTTAYIDGLLRRKGIEHEHIRALTGGTDRVDLWQDQQKRTWGPGGREHFADPKPGDYTGGPVAWDGEQHA